MNTRRDDKASWPEIALPFAVLIAIAFSTVTRAQQPADVESVISRTVRIVEDNKKELERISTEMAPEFARLDEALRAVDAAHAATDVSERERLERAAKAKDAVIAAIDAILAREPETRHLFKGQIDAMRSARSRASASGATPSNDAVSKENREQRKEVAAMVALDPDTPPEWRELFQMAFDLLVLDEDGSDELSKQGQAVLAETIAALDRMRVEFYGAYAEQARAFNSLRSLRRSETLQKDILLSAKDLEALREVSRSARDSVKRLVAGGPTGASSSIGAIREILDRLAKERGKSALPSRSPEQQKRTLQDYANRAKQRIAKAED